jgi:hypothetical protein
MENFILGIKTRSLVPSVLSIAAANLARQNRDP